MLSYLIYLEFRDRIYKDFNFFLIFHLLFLSYLVNDDKFFHRSIVFTLLDVDLTENSAKTVTSMILRLVFKVNKNYDHKGIKIN